MNKRFFPQYWYSCLPWHSSAGGYAVSGCLQLEPNAEKGCSGADVRELQIRVGGWAASRRREHGRRRLSARATRERAHSVVITQAASSGCAATSGCHTPPQRVFHVSGHVIWRAV